jgi:branched-chain amino acid transport system ATP-binding protein
VLVEQNVKAALAIADRAVILVEGRVAHEGRASTLADDPIVAELYLGARKSEGG